MPKAPPEPPSPITMLTTGTFKLDMSLRFLAMASACPLSSAAIPGYAPDVSIKVTIGLLNFPASFITLIAFLYPSGCAMPKFLSIFSLRVLPF